MIALLLSLLISSAHASEYSELRELSKLDFRSTPFIEEELDIKKRDKNNYNDINPIVGLEEILESPEELGALRNGSAVYSLDNSQKKFTTKDIFIRFHRKPDESGFKYLVSKNGDIKFKVRTEDIHSIAPETVMYEAPHSYTPAPEIKRVFWDTKLKSKFEIGLAASMVKAHFLQDLLNLESAPSGQMNHIGLSYLADLDMAVKVGLGVYYQKAQYSTDGGTTNFSTVSFGPVFKSKNFYPFEVAARLLGQFRYSPFGKMDVEISRGSTGFDFNTSDLIFGVEFPIENKIGEFVISLFTHYQWMSLKNQDEIVNIESSNKANQAFGLGISQVF